MQKAAPFRITELETPGGRDCFDSQGSHQLLGCSLDLNSLLKKVSAQLPFKFQRAFLHVSGCETISEYISFGLEVLTGCCEGC